jgi:hypothetical protein
MYRRLYFTDCSLVWFKFDLCRQSGRKQALDRRSKPQGNPEAHNAHCRAYVARSCVAGSFSSRRTQEPTGLKNGSRCDLLPGSQTLVCDSVELAILSLAPNDQAVPG